MDFTLPRHLAASAREVEARATADHRRASWFRRLPEVVAAVAARWRLTVDAPYEPGGQTAWVAPVTSANGHPLVLKVGWRHVEAQHEAAGLRDWDGDGTVRLHDSVDLPDDDTTCLLLERCEPGTPLKALPEPEQDEVIADVLQALWRTPRSTTPYRTLVEMCDEWIDEMEAKVAAGRSRGLDEGILRAGAELFRSLPRDAADPNVLIVTDLHAENVLAAARRPWLVIDPKPHVGDPHYDVLQHLLNCPDRLREDAAGTADRVAALAGLDRERVRLWLFARCVQEAPTWALCAEVAATLAP